MDLFASAKFYLRQPASALFIYVVAAAFRVVGSALADFHSDKSFVQSDIVQHC